MRIRTINPDPGCPKTLRIRPPSVCLQLLMFFLFSGSYFNHFTRGPKRPGVSAFRAKTSQRYQGKVHSWYAEYFMYIYDTNFYYRHWCSVPYSLRTPYVKEKVSVSEKLTARFSRKDCTKLGCISEFQSFINIYNGPIVRYQLRY